MSGADITRWSHQVSIGKSSGGHKESIRKMAGDKPTLILIDAMRRAKGKIRPTTASSMITVVPDESSKTSLRAWCPSAAENRRMRSNH